MFAFNLASWNYGVFVNNQNDGDYIFLNSYNTYVYKYEGRAGLNNPNDLSYQI